MAAPRREPLQGTLWHDARPASLAIALRTLGDAADASEALAKARELWDARARLRLALAA